MDYDYYFDENCLLAIYDNGHIYYTVVQREPELKYTGLSIINRILEDRHKFIGDFYKTQSYFMIKYIDDENIKVDENFYGADRNELTMDELDHYIVEDIFKYIYCYDVSKDVLLIKEPNKSLYNLNFHNRADVEKFIENI